MTSMRDLVGKIEYKIPTWLWRRDEEGYYYIRIYALIGREAGSLLTTKAPLIKVVFPTGDAKEASLVSLTFQDAGKNGFIIDLIYRFRSDGFIDRIKEVLDALIRKGCIKDYLIVEPVGMVIPNIIVKRYASPSGGRIFIKYETFYKGLFSRLIKDYGQLGGLLLERIGESVAREHAEWLKKRGITGIRDALRVTTATGMSLGLYTLKALKTFKTSKEYIVEVILEDLFEEVIYRSEGLSEKSHYQLGFLRGVVKELAGISNQDFTIVETKGYDEKDRKSIFIIKIPLEKLKRDVSHYR